MTLAALRSALTCVGQTALAGELFGVVMFLGALARGVHCPACDRERLGADFGWWASYFGVVDLLQVCGLALGLVALVGAQRRRWGLFALIVGALGIVLRPM